MATTTFMNLTLPDVSVTIGPDWATEINAALTSVDSHDHTSGSGNRITQAGINITEDLDLNAKGLADAGRVSFSNLTALITTAVSTYVKGGDLYFNDASGNQIRITAGGSIDVSSVGGITGDYTTTSASAFYTDAVLKYFFQDSNAARSLVDLATSRLVTTYSSAQTLDYTLDDLVLVSGTTTLTLPAAATRMQFVIKKTDSNATTVTLDGNASETIDGGVTFTMTEQYSSVTICSDGSNWHVI
tara:strand:- start:1803 stop:2534 length:732 start_codon:yes stop_codon:yes gene_type:complete